MLKDMKFFFTNQFKKRFFEWKNLGIYKQEYKNVVKNFDYFLQCIMCAVR
jgi:hypothetical protein